MAEITADQVHDLLTQTHEFIAAGEAVTKARDSLGHLLLDVARQTKVGLRELSAVSGLHHSTIRAMLQRAIGPGLPDGWEQPELPILAELGQPAPLKVESVARTQRTLRAALTPTRQPAPAMSL